MTDALPTLLTVFRVGRWKKLTRCSVQYNTFADYRRQSIEFGVVSIRYDPRWQLFGEAELMRNYCETLQCQCHQQNNVTNPF